MTSWGTRHRGRATVVVMGVVLLGACGDGSSAEPTTPAAVTSTETLAPTPAPTVEPTAVATDRAGVPLVPPERPAAMDNDDVAGAQAAAEYFIEVFGYAVRSQDTTELVALCDPTSNFCSAVLDEISADRSAGNVTIGGASTFYLKRLDPPSAAQGFYVAWGAVERDPFVTMDAGGLEIFDDPGSRGDFMVAVERTSQTWVVRGAEAGVVPAS